MPVGVDNKKRFRIWEPFIVAIAASIGLLAGYKMNFANNDVALLQVNGHETGISSDGRIEEILRFVESNYVDSLNQNEITVDAIVHILKQLDPHSSYVTPEEYNEHNERMEGKYQGVGIETIKLRDTFFITRTIPDGPADKAGLSIGDAILSIEDQMLAGNESSFDDMRQYFNGEKGIDKIKLKYENLARQTELITDLSPSDIIIPSANQSYLVDNKTAYIKLSRFSSNTYEQFMKSLEVLMEGRDNINLIIDLRNNPGGYLPEAIKILCQFFEEKNKLLTFTEGLHRKKAEYKTTGKVFYAIDKIAVLTNNNSASGSEILAGAIQDWDRGVVIGQSTYGKGLVQQVFPLNNGGALRLTVAKYYTPSGRLIQKSYSSISEDFIADTAVYETKLLNRKVDGGGGVDPDYEIAEPSKNSCYEYEDYLDFYLIDLMRKHKKSDFQASDFSADAYNTFITEEYEAEAQVLDLNCNHDIIFEIQARLLRMQKGELNYRKHINQKDAYIAKALEFINNDKSTLALLEDN